MSAQHLVADLEKIVGSKNGFSLNKVSETESGEG
jgi:hypothetical protein